MRKAGAVRMKTIEVDDRPRDLSDNAKRHIALCSILNGSPVLPRVMLADHNP